MTTRREKEQRAEAAVRQAAADLRDINRETELHGETDQQSPQQQQKPGVIGSVLRAVQGTYEHAKDAVVGKSYDTAESTREATASAAEKAKQAKDTTTEKAKETTNSALEKAKEAKDMTVEKTGETKDSALGKAGEYKDYTAEKAKETKDAALGKAGEYKDYTAEKAVEGKDTTVGTLGELKDSATGAAKKAMGFLTGKTEEAKHKTAETTEAAKEKLSETEEAAKKKMEEMKLKDEEYKDEAARRALETKDTEAERGKAATGTIFGSLGNMTEAIKSKFTHPLEEQVGPEKVEINIEETHPGAVSSTMKTSDQMSGQTFNDVGRIAEEGTIRLDRGRNRQGKK
ncbi:hypothetical protein Dsin_006547 [Dipteronia sinensis]|uniref:Late embryogenesis abundant protein ECP63-like domain-containing protein n=1 Tax=Dipteronia sinensis TaxID=43782 RepID=A0AAE0AZH1_9ROSI|nr:hypothetical protein Dsin_006547 [Dipteronia sinensis]